MPSAKVAVSMDPELLARLDRLVRDRAFASRSQAIQVAVREKILRIERSNLASQCVKLAPKFV